MLADVHPATPRKRGLIIGELLLAVLLLAVAVSSLAALMYSVSHRTEPPRESACAAVKGGAPGSCAAKVTTGDGAKLLRSPCITEDGTPARGCNDAIGNPASSGGTILKTRTDSASISLVAKKQKPSESTARPERGFIR